MTRKSTLTSLFVLRAALPGMTGCTSPEHPIEVTVIVPSDDQASEEPAAEESFLTVMVYHDLDRRQGGRVDSLHFAVESGGDATITRLPIHTFDNSPDLLPCTEYTNQPVDLYEVVADGALTTVGPTEWEFYDYLGTPCGETSTSIMGYAVMVSPLEVGAGEHREFILSVNTNGAYGGETLTTSVIATTEGVGRFLWLDGHEERNLAVDNGENFSIAGQEILID